MTATPVALPAVGQRALLADGPDPVLDQAAGVVRHLLRASAAMVTVVGPSTQTFVGACGPPRLVDAPRQVPVSFSFCSEVVRSDRPLVIPDAVADDRWRSHPAIAASGATAYCGVPLRDEDGTTLGSVCAVDHVAHPWTDDDVAALVAFSDLLTRDLSLRRARAEAVRRDALLDDTRALLTHDLRDALHTIGIAAELLPAVKGLPARAVDLVGAIARRSSSATTLLRQLLPDEDSTADTDATLASRLGGVVDEYDGVLADVDVHLVHDEVLRADDRVLVPAGMVERSVAGLVRAAAAGDAPGTIEVRLSLSDGGDLVVDVRRDRGDHTAPSSPDELGQTVAAFAADAWEGSFSSAPGHFRLALPMAPRPASD